MSIFLHSTFNTQRILLYLDLVDRLEIEKMGLHIVPPSLRSWIQTLQLVVSEVQPASRRRRF